MTVPMLPVFFLARRRFIRGITMTGLKGRAGGGIGRTAVLP